MIHLFGEYINFDLPALDECQNFLLNKIKLDKLIFPGIYFLISSKNEVLYIGESAKLGNRLKQHIEKEKVLECWRNGDDVYSISILPVKFPYERFLLEKAYIMGLKPKYNKETKEYGYYNFTEWIAQKTEVGVKNND